MGFLPVAFFLKRTIINLMRIKGIQKLSLVDFPSKMSSILFTGGCNFRCPFCHNSRLVLHPEVQEDLDIDEIFSFLEKRKNMLDGVVVTGGEATLQSDLVEFLEKIKNLGYLVKLDTNGYKPDVLESVISQKCADYIAMDIKNSLDSYAMTSGIEDFDKEKIIQSASVLMSSGIDYEFRTTVVAELHGKENFEKIGLWLKGARIYFLQSFVPSENTIEKNFSKPSADALKNYAEILRNYIDNVQIRNS